MTIQKKLLVLVDGTERSIQTVNYLKDFMPVDEATRIVLFHVLSTLPEEYRDLVNNPTYAKTAVELRDWEAAEEKKIQAYLDRAKKILTTAGFPEPSVEIKLHYLEKDIAQDIIEEAKNGYSAVILRRRGRGALKSLILGSVAVKLLESLKFIPIIIVGPAPPLKKILLAVDASPSSMKAVKLIGSLLGGQGYEVCIFHAILGLGAINFEVSGEYTQKLPDVQIPQDSLEAFKLKVGQLFQEVKKVLMTSGFESEKITEKIISGVYSRSDTIVKEAESGGYSTIVVGRRGLSKIDAFFMGRVGHKVVYGGKKFTVWVV